LVIAQINYDREQEINNLLNKSSAYRRGEFPKNFTNDYKQLHFNNESNKTQKTLSNFGSNSRKQNNNKRGTSFNNSNFSNLI
jgi:hypothetical protein